MPRGDLAPGEVSNRRGNPVLRDVTERVVIASKGRFDRALDPVRRAVRRVAGGRHHLRDEFLEATTDLWELAPESATRVGHPAPFPVELPRRLIELYTYEDDVILDPFAGSGTTAVAAVRTGRHYIGFDTDAGYVAAARQRVASTARDEVVIAGDASVADAVATGQQAKEVAGLLLETCGFASVRRDVKVAGLGIELAFAAIDETGREWRFDVAGAFVTGDGGLGRGDALWPAIGRAAVLGGDTPYALLTTHVPAPSSAAGRALAVVRGPGRPIRDVIQLLDQRDRERLAAYARKGP